MATITNYNVQEYIDQGLIDPKKIKIDLNVTKTTSDPNHKWISLDAAIKQGLKFNFDYNVKSIKENKSVDLPELIVTANKPEPEPEQNNKTPWSYASDNFKNTFGFSVRDALGFVPYLGDALDIKDIGYDLYNGNYLNAGIGAGMFLIPNVIEKPIRYLKDLWWLTKTYNKVGTGLKNPFVRKQYLDLAKSPTTSRNFIETYSRSNESGLTLEQIKEAIPKLQELNRIYGITPKADFKDYNSVDDQIKRIENGLSDAAKISESYKNGLEYLKTHNQILYDIVQESPQYLDQIMSDLLSGKIINTQQYVKDLITQSNTFIRRMNIRNSENPAKQFLEIRGHTLGDTKNYAMDVGNKQVVFDPLLARGYGSTAMIYVPKNRELIGPIETWWSQRFPKFNDNSIIINNNGMHSSRNGIISDHSLNSVFNMNRLLQKNNIPVSYGRTSAHMTFLSPNEGATISDQFDVFPFDKQNNIKFTLGYKLGGKFNTN